MKRILCAVDFSDFSRAALAMAVMLARAWEARLFVFHAVSFPRAPYHGRPRTGLDYRPGGGIDRAVEKIKEMIGDIDLHWEPVVVDGDPVEELLAHAERLSIDLSVAASYGLSGIKRMLVGTVVEQMVRHLALPLFVVRPGNRGRDDARGPNRGIRRVLVGLNPADEKIEPCKVAACIAHRFNAELHVVGALASPMDEAVVSPTGAPYEEVQETLLERVRQRLSGLVSTAVPPDCSYRVAVLPGAPEEALKGYALEHRVDLVAVGVRLESRVKKMLIGSTTEAMLRRAPCAVLTVPSALFQPKPIAGP